MKYIILGEDLWKIYKVGEIEYPALKGVNIAVKYSEFIAIVGPSGSGKSTLLHLIGGLDKPTKGRVIIDGTDITRLSEDELADYRCKTIGFVFQFYNLIPYLTAVENVELPMAIAKSSIDRFKRAMELLELVGLRDKAFKRPTELSAGEQQRVAIARALANNPRIILADEPTGNLDSTNSEIIMKLFRDLVDNYNVTIVMVTHNLELVKFCNRIARLKDGCIEYIKEVG